MYNNAILVYHVHGFGFTLVSIFEPHNVVCVKPFQILHIVQLYRFNTLMKLFVPSVFWEKKLYFKMYYAQTPFNNSSHLNNILNILVHCIIVIIKGCNLPLTHRRRHFLHRSLKSNLHETIICNIIIIMMVIMIIICETQTGRTNFKHT